MEFEQIKSLQHKSLQIWWNLVKSRVYNTRVYKFGGIWPNQEFTTQEFTAKSLQLSGILENPGNQEFTAQEFNPRRKEFTNLAQEFNPRRLLRKDNSARGSEIPGYDGSR